MYQGLSYNHIISQGHAPGPVILPCCFSRSCTRTCHTIMLHLKVMNQDLSYYHVISQGHVPGTCHISGEPCGTPPGPAFPSSQAWSTGRHSVWSLTSRPPLPLSPDGWEHHVPRALIGWGPGALDAPPALLCVCGRSPELGWWRDCRALQRKQDVWHLLWM